MHRQGKTDKPDELGVKVSVATTINLLRLWREKRGELEPEDLSNNLIVQLGTVTERLNRHWYERNKRFWRCVETGEAPQLVWRRAATGEDRGGPDRRYERVKRLGRVCRPVSGDPQAAQDHERSRAELKALVPADAREASGHGVPR